MAYKVVHKETRRGSNYTMACRNKADKEKADGYVRLYPEWFPKYEKGTKVRAVPDSEGLLCFETLEDAHAFIARYRIRWISRIVRVKGWGRRAGPPLLRIGCCNPSRLFGKSSSVYGGPPGTIAYTMVKVLE